MKDAEGKAHKWLSVQIPFFGFGINIFLASIWIRETVGVSYSVNCFVHCLRKKKTLAVFVPPPREYFVSALLRLYASFVVNQLLYATYFSHPPESLELHLQIMYLTGIKRILGVPWLSSFLTVMQESGVLLMKDAAKRRFLGLLIRSHKTDSGKSLLERLAEQTDSKPAITLGRIRAGIPYIEE